MSPIERIAAAVAEIKQVAELYPEPIRDSVNSFAVAIAESVLDTINRQQQTLAAYQARLDQLDALARDLKKERNRG